MTHRVLPLEGTDEPPQHPLHAFLLVGAFGNSRKQIRVFTPIRRELCQ